MSAIISFKCKNCHRHPYVSLSHPDWWKERKGEEYDLYQKIIHNGLCQDCDLETWTIFILTMQHDISCRFDEKDERIIYFKCKRGATAELFFQMFDYKRLKTHNIPKNQIKDGKNLLIIGKKT